MLSMSILRMHFCLFFFLDQQLHVFHVCRHQNKRCSRSKCLTRLLAIAFNIFENRFEMSGRLPFSNQHVEKLFCGKISRCTSSRNIRFIFKLYIGNFDSNNEWWKVVDWKCQIWSQSNFRGFFPSSSKIKLSSFYWVSKVKYTF